MSIGNGLETIEKVANVYQTKSKAFEKIQNLETPISSMFKEADEAIQLSQAGTVMLKTLNIDQTGGPAAFYGGFQTPGSNNYIKPVVMPKKQLFPVVISKDLALFTKGQDIAFGEAPKEILQAQRDIAARQRELQCVGIGTGQLAIANGSATSTALVVDDVTQFIVRYALEAYYVSGGKWTKRTTFANGVNDAPYITKIDPATSTLTLSKSVTWVDGDVIVKAGTMDTAVYGNSLQTGLPYTGIRAIASSAGEFDDNFQNIDTSTNDNYLYNGTVVDAAGSPITQDLLNQTINLAYFQTGNDGGGPNVLISDRQQLRVFKNTELQKVRYVDTQELNTGAVKVKYDKFEWTTANNIYGGEVMLLKTDDIRWVTAQDLKLSPPVPGQSPFTQVGNQDAFSCYYTEVKQLALTAAKRANQVRITNLFRPAWA